MSVLTLRHLKALALSFLSRRMVVLFVTTLLIANPLAAQTTSDGNGPPATPAKFVVYFDFNSIKLSRDSRAEIGKAAAAITQQGAIRVLITGHADAVGDETYNLTLSMRRAQSVVAELKTQGVAPTVIQADWRGEFDPAVPGVPNMPAQANRRVEIELQFKE